MPLLAELVEVIVVFIHPVDKAGFQFVVAVDDHIQGHAHRQVAFHGGIEGNQSALVGPVQRGLIVHDAVEDGLAVFGLTDLKIRRFFGGFDEVAFGVNVEQACLFAPESGRPVSVSS